MPFHKFISTSWNRSFTSSESLENMPYTPGVNYTVVIDGFLVSDNVQASAKNIDAGFAYSDHNPVQLTFSLK